jgi:hypothetical protein
MVIVITKAGNSALRHMHSLCEFVFAFRCAGRLYGPAFRPVRRVLVGRYRTSICLKYEQLPSLQCGII